MWTPSWCLLQVSWHTCWEWSTACTGWTAARCRTPTWLGTGDTNETVSTSQTLTLNYMQSLLANLQVYWCFWKILCIRDQWCLVSNTSESHFQELVLILWCTVGSSSHCFVRWLNLSPLSLLPAFIKLSRPLPKVSLPLWLEFVRRTPDSLPGESTGTQHAHINYVCLETEGQQWGSHLQLMMMRTLFG